MPAAFAASVPSPISPENPLVFGREARAHFVATSFATMCCTPPFIGGNSDHDRSLASRFLASRSEKPSRSLPRRARSTSHAMFCYHPTSVESRSVDNRTLRMTTIRQATHLIAGTHSMLRSGNQCLRHSSRCAWFRLAALVGLAWCSLTGNHLPANKGRCSISDSVMIARRLLAVVVTVRVDVCKCNAPTW